MTPDRDRVTSAESAQATAEDEPGRTSVAPEGDGSAEPAHPMRPRHRARLPLRTEPVITVLDGVTHLDYRGVAQRYLPKKLRKPRSRRGISAQLLRPSPALAAVIGPDPVTRTRALQDLWHHITTSCLQDPLDRRTILADDKLRAVFGKDRASMFEVGRLLSAHLAAVGDGGGATAPPREAIEAKAGR